MGAQDWVLIISAVTTGLVAVIGAVFAGWVAIKQMPRQAVAVQEAKQAVAEQKAATEDVHTLVNRNFSEQKDEIAGLRETVKQQNADALAKAEGKDNS